ncbi:MAG: hypothetical protein WAU47_01950 [Desulfobaccales bacterium]
MGWVLFFCLLVIAGGMAGSGLILALPQQMRAPLAGNLISYATGTLLGAVFLGLLPEALEKAPHSLVFLWFLAGLLAFFLLEKLVLWRHCQKEECAVLKLSSGLSGCQRRKFEWCPDKSYIPRGEESRVLGFAFWT